MLKTLFFGNSSFCMPTLMTLAEKTNLQAIVTGLDQWIMNRKKTLAEPLPKAFAKERGIPFLQPKTLKDPEFLAQLQQYSPDIMVVISYGKILPKEVFHLPPMGTFNIHASLLPSYRGASPIQEALLHGDKKTGITLQKINEHIDDGDIYAVSERDITPSMKYPELYEFLALDAAQTLGEFLDAYTTMGKLPDSRKQLGEPSFCRKITKEDGIISFCDHSAQEIFNRFRAYAMWPQISTSIRGISVKLEDIELVSSDSRHATPGTVLKADRQAFYVQAKEGVIFLRQLKVSNKKSIDYASFLNGYQIKQGDVLC